LHLGSALPPSTSAVCLSVAGAVLPSHVRVVLLMVRGGGGRSSLDVWSVSARRLGFPSRSVFKLDDVDRRWNILQSSHRVIDLGASPLFSLSVSPPVVGRCTRLSDGSRPLHRPSTSAAAPHPGGSEVTLTHTQWDTHTCSPLGRLSSVRRVGVVPAVLSLTLLRCSAVGPDGANEWGERD